MSGVTPTLLGKMSVCSMKIGLQETKSIFKNFKVHILAAPVIRR